MKITAFLTCLFLLFCAAPSTAAIRDVPVGHWSNVAIYELVSRGITQGYPDGTFRGDKLITRYETAVFLNELERSVLLDRAVSEKLVEELKVELESVKEDIEKYKEIPVEVYKSSGSFSIRSRHARDINEDRRLQQIDYRVQYSLEKEFGRDFNVKFSLDTLDAGFGGGNRDLVEKMLMIEAKTKLNFFGFLGDLEGKLAPGKAVHREINPQFNADDVTVIYKPNKSVSYSTIYKGYYISVAYVARSLSDTGYPYSKEIGAKIGFPKFSLPYLGNVSATLAPKHIFRDQPVSTYEANDTRAELEIKVLPSPKIEGKALFGMRSDRTPDRSYLNLSLSINDYFNTGTYFSVLAQKVGSDYRVPDLDKYDLGVPNSLYNLFDKFVFDGTSDIGARLSQKLSDFSEIYVKGDATLDDKFRYGEKFPGTALILQEGLLVYIPPGAVLDVFIKNYEVPSGLADAADPMYSRLVLKSTEIIGASLNFTF